MVCELASEGKGRGLARDKAGQDSSGSTHGERSMGFWGASGARVVETGRTLRVVEDIGEEVELREV